MTDCKSYISFDGTVTYEFSSNDPKHLQRVRTAIRRCLKEERERAELSKLKYKYDR